ncbi:unnamed protein product [Symbiodinium sp. CCMP2592]|nr:unnamed protein product [Symbiodinium sp. CCMP2592]
MEFSVRTACKPRTHEATSAATRSLTSGMPPGAESPPGWSARSTPRVSISTAWNAEVLSAHTVRSSVNIEITKRRTWTRQFRPGRRLSRHGSTGSASASPAPRSCWNPSTKRTRKSRRRGKLNGPS